MLPLRPDSLFGISRLCYRGRAAPALERVLPTAALSIYETAQAAVKREIGIRANVLTIGKEAQKRGAVHGHFVLGCESALELQAARAFRRHLERLSSHRRYEFGHVNGKFVKPKDAREAAAYLSSYFVRGRGHKAPLTEAVTNGELPRLPLYVSRRLTAVTRTTMRNKRRQRHLHICKFARTRETSVVAGRAGTGGRTRAVSARAGSATAVRGARTGCRAVAAVRSRRLRRLARELRDKPRRLAQACLHARLVGSLRPSGGASPSTRPSRASSTHPLRTEHHAPWPSRRPERPPA